MYNYVHTAVARPLEHQIPKSPKPTRVILPERRVKTLSSGEKLFYLGSLLGCIFSALFVLQGRVQLTDVNLKINKVEKQLVDTRQQNIQLNIEGKEANSYDNIQNFIAKHKLVKISSRTITAKNSNQSTNLTELK